MVTVPPPQEKKALSSDWDGWPDGTFEREFTFEEVDACNNLQVHWATKSHGIRGGNDFAEDWTDGKKATPRLLGNYQVRQSRLRNYHSTTDY